MARDAMLRAFSYLKSLIFGRVIVVGFTIFLILSFGLANCLRLVGDSGVSHGSDPGETVAI